ncbi:epimerase [Reichenbachiella ulvae]|uniref:Epimerase n=1 Tax=Reichenbachiella ulvae TaxID=2980104 RepID=A0ABT3CPX6_9BACT|nr:epimerase [Reichenbachiella ulvae]MCV9385672.1 epimerase [Reichenbachiella ulvae]
MNVIITGASGMVGKGVLLECLDDDQVERVLTIGRSEIDIEHPKLEKIIHDDFNDYTIIKDRLKGYDACFLCMGISAAGLNEMEYQTITYDYTLALAKTLQSLNPNMTCTYVSGQGTDSTENGRIMWARVKGRTENALLNLGFRQAYMFRPGAIIPLRGIKSKTRSYQFMYDYFMWLVKLIKFFAPNSVVNTTQIGRAMIRLTQKGYSRSIIDPKDIIVLAQ